MSEPRGSKSHGFMLSVMFAIATASSAPWWFDRLFPREPAPAPAPAPVPASAPAPIASATTISEPTMMTASTTTSGVPVSPLATDADNAAVTELLKALAKQPAQPGPDSCRFALDDNCDEPAACASGTDTTDCRLAQAYIKTALDAMAAPAQAPQMQYCCDQFGQKWCAILINPGPVGSPCICAGVPGAGQICY